MKQSMVITVAAVLLTAGCSMYDQYHVNQRVMSGFRFPAGYKIAVLPFSAPAAGTTQLSGATLTTSEHSGETVADAVASALLRFPDLAVVERAQIQRIFREHELSLSDFVSEPDFTQIGGMLPVDAVVIGNVSQFNGWTAGMDWGSSVGFSGRLVNISSGRVLFTFDCHASISNGMADAMAFKLADDAMRRIQKQLRAER